jgi:hypothetical protein
MTNFELKIENIDQVVSAIKNKMGNAEEAAKGALGALASMVEREAKLRSVAGGSHARGEPTTATPGGGPARVTGALFRSIAAQPVRVGFGTYTADITAGMEYARALELGNPLWTSGVNYPYMQPALDSFQGRQGDIFTSLFLERWKQ